MRVLCRFQSDHPRKTAPAGLGKLTRRERPEAADQLPVCSLSPRACTERFYFALMKHRVRIHLASIFVPGPIDRSLCDPGSCAAILRLPAPVAGRSVDHGRQLLSLASSDALHFDYSLSTLARAISKHFARSSSVRGDHADIHRHPYGLGEPPVHQCRPRRVTSQYTLRLCFGRELAPDAKAMPQHGDLPLTTSPL